MCVVPRATNYLLVYFYKGIYLFDLVHFSEKEKTKLT